MRLRITSVPCVLSEDLEVVGDGLKGQGGTLLWGRPFESSKVTEEETTEAQKLEDAVLIHVCRRAWEMQLVGNWV